MEEEGNEAVISESHAVFDEIDDRGFLRRPVHFTVNFNTVNTD